jgi:dissimilatory sulfite reductase (desulfoviridin) alpha/beta subunit
MIREFASRLWALGRGKQAARELDGETAPFYQLLVGGGQQGGVMRFGQLVTAVPARLAPQAVRRIITFYKAERLPRESFLEFVDRRGIDSFRSELAGMAAGTAENVFIDWGEQQKFVLQVARGECST